MISQEYANACDLMVEDLWEVHSRIRVMAKELGCESELEKVKNELLVYLKEKRNS